MVPFLRSTFVSNSGVKSSGRWGRLNFLPFWDVETDFVNFEFHTAFYNFISSNNNRSQTLKSNPSINSAPCADSAEEINWKGSFEMESILWSWISYARRTGLVMVSTIALIMMKLINIVTAAVTVIKTTVLSILYILVLYGPTRAPQSVSMSWNESRPKYLLPL